VRRGTAESARRTNERETVVSAPQVVEPPEAELSPTGVGPQAENVSTTEETEPGIMKEDQRSFTLDVGIFDPEVESVFVYRPLEVPSRRLGESFG